MPAALEVERWRLAWVRHGAAAPEGVHQLLSGWDDLDDAERALGIRDGQPILVAPDGSCDPRLSRFFMRSRFATLAPGSQRSYASDLCVFLNFLCTRGVTWLEATADDLADFEWWRRRDTANPARVSASKSNRELAALRLLYDWAALTGLIAGSPVVLASGRGRDGRSSSGPALRSKDVRSANVKWLTPRFYRRWRDIGLGGYGIDGRRDRSWRGRGDGRNVAFAELLWSSGLRLREAGSMLVCELPTRSGRAYCRGRVPAATSKWRGRDFWASEQAMAAIDAYRMTTRAEAVRRAQAQDRYRELARMRIVSNVSARGDVHFVDDTGAPGRVTLDALASEERCRLFVDGEAGLEPAMLWLGEGGMPLHYQTWDAVFAAGTRRSRALGIEEGCHPHMLRHSFALRMLVTLQLAFDRRLGLSPEERREYRLLFGDPWTMVKDLLGHRSIDTTRDIYLEPVTGLQIELFLDGDDQEATVSELLAQVARASDRVADVADGAVW